MTKFIQKIKTFIFGERQVGITSLPKPRVYPMRELNEKEYYEWCQEFRVSTMVNKKY